MGWMTARPRGRAAGLRCIYMPFAVHYIPHFCSRMVGFETWLDVELTPSMGQDVGGFWYLRSSGRGDLRLWING